jgi:hypothetical protein
VTVERVVHEWAYVESSVGGGGEALVDATRTPDQVIWASLPFPDHKRKTSQQRLILTLIICLTDCHYSPDGSHHMAALRDRGGGSGLGRRVPLDRIYHSRLVATLDRASRRGSPLMLLGRQARCRGLE